MSKFVVNSMIDDAKIAANPEFPLLVQLVHAGHTATNALLCISKCCPTMDMVSEALANAPDEERELSTEMQVTLAKLAAFCARDGEKLAQNARIAAAYVANILVAVLTYHDGKFSFDNFVAACRCAYSWYEAHTKFAVEALKEIDHEVLPSTVADLFDVLRKHLAAAEHYIKEFFGIYNNMVDYWESKPNGTVN